MRLFSHYLLTHYQTCKTSKVIIKAALAYGVKEKYISSPTLDVVNQRFDFGEISTWMGASPAPMPTNKQEVC